MSADLLARLIATGTPPDLVAEVARLEARAAMVEEALEGRRAADRNRQQNRRGARASRDITLGSVTTRDVTDAPPPDKEKSPRPSKEINLPRPIDEADASSTGPKNPVSPDRPKKGGSERPDRQQPDRQPGDRQPSERQRKGARIPDDWTPPLIDDLPPMAQALASQWPAGAYAAQGELFAAYWRGEGGRQGARKLDWTQTWCNWIGRVTGQVLRDAKAGVRFAADAPARQRTAAEIERDERLARELDALHRAETAEARAIRERIRRDAGARTYDGWVKPCAIAIEGDDIIVSSPSEFVSGWLEQHFAATFTGVGGTVLGRPVRQVLFRVVKPPG
jgi:hypothetical protein